VLADAASTLGADVLVVGSRGHGSISGALLGSVSHALVRRSPVPLTIVRHSAVAP
jgi:nucleotide-binding universal stress UspA family protein